MPSHQKSVGMPSNHKLGETQAVKTRHQNSLGCLLLACSRLAGPSMNPLPVASLYQPDSQAVRTRHQLQFQSWAFCTYSNCLLLACASRNPCPRLAGSRMSPLPVASLYQPESSNQTPAFHLPLFAVSPSAGSLSQPAAANCQLKKLPPVPSKLDCSSHDGYASED